MPTKNRQTPADRFRVVYETWKSSEAAHGRSANLVGFATVLDFDSHSAVGDQLNGRRDLSTKVLRACRERWHISADWLLYGDGPMHVFEAVSPGTTEEQVSQYIARRLASEHAAALAARSAVTVAQGEDSPPVGAMLRIDGASALQAAYEAAVREMHARLEHMDLESVTIEALRQAQSAAVHGSRHAPLIAHAAFSRVLDRQKSDTAPQTGIVRREWRHG